MEQIDADVNLVARCGLYCGACGAHRKGRCPGCQQNHKAAWCKVRSCCHANHYAYCADCTEYPNPRDCPKFNNIIATGGSLASSITGLPGYPIENVSLSNVDITMVGGGTRPAKPVPEVAGDYPHAPMFGPLPASGLYVRHVKGLSLTNVRLRTAQPDKRRTLVLDDVVRVRRGAPN